MKELTIYVAKDGKEFTEKSECVSYEETLDALEVYKNFLKSIEINNIECNPELINPFPLRKMDVKYSYYFIKDSSDMDMFLTSLGKVYRYKKFYNFEKLKDIQYPLFAAYNYIRQDLVFNSDIINKIDTLRTQLRYIYKKIETQFGYKFDYE